MNTDPQTTVTRRALIQSAAISSLGFAMNGCTMTLQTRQTNQIQPATPPDLIVHNATITTMKAYRGEVQAPI